MCFKLVIMCIGRKGLLVFIAAALLYISIAISGNYWFVGDEGFYAISIFEAIKNGIRPYITFLGTPVFWKPFLMIDAYAPIIQMLGNTFPPYIAYRLPSALFSAVNVLLVYLISKEIFDEEKSLLISVFYALNPIILLFGTKLFIESFTMMFVFAGMLTTIHLCKIQGTSTQLLHSILIGLTIICASFSKSTTIGIMAFMIFMLYAFVTSKKRINEVMAGGIIAGAVIIIVPFLTEFPEAFFSLYAEDFFTRRIGTGLYPDNAITILTLLLYLLPLLLISVRSLSIRDKNDVFFLLWLLPLVPIMFLTPYSWYGFYFVLPLLAISLKGISTKNKLELLVAAVLLLIGVFVCLAADASAREMSELRTIEYMEAHYEDGQCVLFAGALSPMTIAYLEIKGYGLNAIVNNAPIILQNGTKQKYVLDANLTQEELQSLVDNYMGTPIGENITNRKYLFGRWKGDATDIKLKTTNANCKTFDYVLVTDYYKRFAIDGYSLVSDEEQIRVWKRLPNS